MNYKAFVNGALYYMEQEATFIKHLQVLLQLGELQEMLLIENGLYDGTFWEFKGCAILVFNFQLLPLFKGI